MALPYEKTAGKIYYDPEPTSEVNVMMPTITMTPPFWAATYSMLFTSFIFPPFFFLCGGGGDFRTTPMTTWTFRPPSVCNCTYLFYISPVYSGLPGSRYALSGERRPSEPKK